MSYETRSTTDPAPNDDGTPHGTVPYNVAGMTVGDRNTNSDCRTISGVAGKDSETVSVDLDNSGVQIITKGSSLAAEKRSGGWTKYTAPIGGMPRAEETVGTRGAADSGRI